MKGNKSSDQKDKRENKPETDQPQTPKGDSVTTKLTKPEQAPPATPHERTEGIP